jgi:hypothetical protein
MCSRSPSRARFASPAMPRVPVWIAVYCSEECRHIRCIVAHTPGELAAKLETAEQVEL